MYSEFVIENYNINKRRCCDNMKKQYVDISRENSITKASIRLDEDHIWLIQSDFDKAIKKLNN